MWDERDTAVCERDKRVASDLGPPAAHELPFGFAAFDHCEHQLADLLAARDKRRCDIECGAPRGKERASEGAEHLDPVAALRWNGGGRGGRSRAAALGEATEDQVAVGRRQTFREPADV